MKSPLTIPLAMAMLSMAGCRSDNIEIAREALHRQADQNEAMAALQREVAAGARELVAVDADARRRLLDVHSQLQTERAELSADWRHLESNRRDEISRARRDSFLTALVQGGAATAVALLALAVVRAAMEPSSLTSDEQLTTMLLDRLDPAQSVPLAPTVTNPTEGAPFRTLVKQLTIRHPEES